jgi:hypothetical protein
MVSSFARNQGFSFATPLFLANSYTVANKKPLFLANSYTIANKKPLFPANSYTIANEKHKEPAVLRVLQTKNAKNLRFLWFVKRKTQRTEGSQLY